MSACPVTAPLATPLDAAPASPAPSLPPVITEAGPPASGDPLTRALAPAELSPTELVALARAGRQQAWDELMRRYGRLVYSVARRHRLSGAECDDVAQATWLRLVQNITGLRDPERCGDWLAAVARNESLRVITRERRAQPVAEPLEGTSALNTARPEEPEEVVLRNDDMRLVTAALESLRPTDQQLLRLVLRDPVPSYAEISAETGIPVASIGPTRTRCLRRLRAALAAVGYDRNGPVRQLPAT